MPTVFFAFRDAPDRRAALRRAKALDRYRLFGMDQIEDLGANVRHNLERDTAPHWARAIDRFANTVVALGGDFAGVLPSLAVANRADVVLATVDTVGIPILWLRGARVLRPPVVYVSIGLPERLRRLRSVSARRRFAAVLRGARAIVAYAEHEAEELRHWLGAPAPPILFVPFGVDVHAFEPEQRAPAIDVVSVGADPLRDFDLLVRVAERHPDRRFLLVATTDRLRALGRLPANVVAETNLPLETVRDRLAGARVVALPVRSNSYSGATTTLLQAMAMAKPVVVSKTDAIARGYELEDHFNCRLVPPGDVDAFDRALAQTLTGADAARSLGIRARETVVQSFSWERYTKALWSVLFPAT